MTASVIIFVPIGLVILLGTMGARFFQKISIPQVVGFITVGIIIGRSGFHLIDKDILDRLNDVNNLALGIIGFTIGGELNYSELRKHKRELVWLLMSQGLGALFLGGISCQIVIYLFTGKLAYSIATGLVLGGVAVATAPAATVEVLREYKAKGPVTSILYEMISLDDILCLVVFSLVIAFARIISPDIVLQVGNTAAGLLPQLLEVLREIVGSAFLGIIAGFLLNRLIRSIRDSEKTLDYAVGILLLLVSCAKYLHLNVILSAMVLGIVLVNLAPHRSQKAFEAVNRFSPPIYVLFFVFGGARLVISDLDVLGWTVVLVYVLGRALGKVAGAYFGARMAGSVPAVRNYMGIGLLDQAGVAIGLAIVSQQYLEPHTGSFVLAVVTAAIFINQLLSPSMIKYAIMKAGEVGRGFSEQDLIQMAKVRDLMTPPPSPSLTESSDVHRILDAFAQTPAIALPIVDSDGKPIGMIDAEQIKDAWVAYDCHSPVVAEDVFKRLVITVAPDEPLDEALTKIQEYNQNAVPVVSDEKLIGILDSRVVHHVMLEKIVKGEAAQFAASHCK